MKQKMLFSLTLVLFALLSVPGMAQQSSKSKSKDRFREKTNDALLLARQVAVLNTAGSERSPAFYQGGLVFNPGRYGQYFAFSGLDANGQPTAAVRFDVTVPGHVLPRTVTFSRDDSTAFFTCVGPMTQSSPTRERIFWAKRSAAGWAGWQELWFNNAAEFSCTHPTLSADGRTLYFASDRPGGFGGLDLWKVERSPAGPYWGQPVNLGPNVNTAGQEDYPFVTTDGMLFFASDGRANAIGGLDLYYFELALNAATPTVVGLGNPFNSSGNDYGLILRDDGKSGFFVSDRLGGMGETDIYTFSVDQ